MVTRLRKCDERIAVVAALAISFKATITTRRSRSLSKANAEGKRLSGDLRALLQMKNRAEYGADPVSADQRKRAWRRAENLVEAARA
jgi:hypothetical protein